MGIPLNRNALKNVRIAELSLEELPFSKLKFRYFTKNYYAITVLRREDGWKIKLVLEELPERIEKGPLK